MTVLTGSFQLDWRSRASENRRLKILILKSPLKRYFQKRMIAKENKTITMQAPDIANDILYL